MVGWGQQSSYRRRAARGVQRGREAGCSGGQPAVWGVGRWQAEKGATGHCPLGRARLLPALQGSIQSKMRSFTEEHNIDIVVLGALRLGLSLSRGRKLTPAWWSLGGL